MITDENLGSKMSHQNHEQNTGEVYKDAEVPLQWTDVLKDYYDELGITFFTTPYDLNTTQLDPYVPVSGLVCGDVVRSYGGEGIPARLSLHLLLLKVASMKWKSSERWRF